MYSLWMGLDSVGGTVTRSVWGHMKNSHTNNDTSVIWFGSDCVHASSVNMFKNKIDKYLAKAGYT